MGEVTREEQRFLGKGFYLWSEEGSYQFRRKSQADVVRQVQGNSFGKDSSTTMTSPPQDTLQLKSRFPDDFFFNILVRLRLNHQRGGWTQRKTPLNEVGANIR